MPGRGGGAVVVGADHEPLTDREGAVRAVDGRAEHPVVEERAADGGVEGVDGLVGAGEKHRDGAGVVGGQPPVHGLADHGRSVASDDDPAVGLVGGDGAGDVAVTQLGQGHAFPAVVLAAVDGQFGDGGGGVGGEGGEPAASGDLGELVVVADEKHPAAGFDHGGGEAVEVTEPGHCGLVDHEQGAGVGAVVAAGPGAEPAVNGGRGDVGVGLELVGSLGRGRPQGPGSRRRRRPVGRRRG
ncbi:MAG: hypothetical protein M5T61_16195 [Acidimicrobiia bacterium]|nr:hypothetical protein [Acidimicrobiia bacterium]